MPWRVCCHPEGPAGARLSELVNVRKTMLSDAEPSQVRPLPSRSSCKGRVNPIADEADSVLGSARRGGKSRAPRCKEEAVAAGLLGEQVIDVGPLDHTAEIAGEAVEDHAGLRVGIDMFSARGGDCPGIVRNLRHHEQQQGHERDGEKQFEQGKGAFPGEALRESVTLARFRHALSFGRCLPPSRRSP